MTKLFANSGDHDQTQCSAASDLGLHCLPVTLLQISRLQWVNLKFPSIICNFVPYEFVDIPIFKMKLNRLPHTIYWKSPISILVTPSYEIYILLEKNG